MALAYAVQVHQGGRSWLTVARCIDAGAALMLVPRYVADKAVRIRLGGKDYVTWAARSAAVVSVPVCRRRACACVGAALPGCYCKCHDVRPEVSV